MTVAVGLDKLFNAPGFRAFLDQLVRDMGVTDRVEVMLLEQLALAHFRVAQLHIQAEEARGPAADVYNHAAARLMGEFRRTALALPAYRAARPRECSTGGSRKKRVPPNWAVTRSFTMPAKEASGPPNPRRVAAGKLNRQRRGPTTEEGKRRLREAIARVRPWRFARGPKTAEGKRRAADNGRYRQHGERSARQLREDVADVRRLVDALGAVRRLAAQELAQDVQGRTPLLPAGPPHRH
jgi:hypothetical protein